MITAVIFDCFGVLASDGWLPFKDEHFAADPARYAEATRLNKKSDSGLASYGDFIHSIAELAGTSEAAARQAIEHNVPNGPLFEYIQTQLKPSYRLGLLSNASQNWLPRIFTPSQLGLFDAVALSCDIGAVKPQPEAYAEIARRLGVSADQCVLVDDQPKYCDGARAAGMAAIEYTSLPVLKTQLTQLLA